MQTFTASNDTLSRCATALAAEVFEIDRAIAYASIGQVPAVAVDIARSDARSMAERIATSYGFQSAADAVAAIERRTSRRFVHSIHFEDLVAVDAN